MNIVPQIHLSGKNAGRNDLKKEVFMKDSTEPESLKNSPSIPDSQEPRDSAIEPEGTPVDSRIHSITEWVDDFLSESML